MELGRSDAFLVLDHADLLAVRLGVRGRMYNTGQACAADQSASFCTIRSPTPSLTERGSSLRTCGRARTLSARSGTAAT
jgi:hypothetical protein